MNTLGTDYILTIEPGSFYVNNSNYHFKDMKDAFMMLCNQDPTELSRSNELYSRYFIIDHAGNKIVEMLYSVADPRLNKDNLPSVYFHFFEGIKEFESKYKISLELFHGYNKSNNHLPIIQVKGHVMMHSPWPYMSGFSAKDDEDFKSKTKFSTTYVSVSTSESVDDFPIGESKVWTNTYHFPSLKAATKHALESDFDLMLFRGYDVELIRGISVHEKVERLGTVKKVEVVRIMAEDNVINFKIIDHKHLSAKLDKLELEGKVISETVAIFDDANATYYRCNKAESIERRISEFQEKEWSAKGGRPRVLLSNVHLKNKGKRK